VEYARWLRGSLGRRLVDGQKKTRIVAGGAHNIDRKTEQEWGPAAVLNIP